jgi:hypothetical protein
MLGKKRLSFTNRQRRRLAVKAKLLGRAVLNEIATIVTVGGANALCRTVRFPCRHSSRSQYDFMRALGITGTSGGL